MIEEKKFIKNFLPGVLFALLLLLIEYIEEEFRLDLEEFGVYPRTFKGLIGVITFPFIHDDYKHWFSNAIPLVVLSGFILYFYRKIAWKVIFLIYLLSGLWTWCLGRPAFHIGASGLVYGFASFLFFAGLFRNDRNALAVSLIVVFLYGSMIWGIFPLVISISWEGHLAGALAGLLLAFNYRKFDPPKKEYPWMEEGYIDPTHQLLFPDEHGNYPEEKPEDSPDKGENENKVDVNSLPLKFKYVYIPKKPDEKQQG
ncbi:MAG TPA: rhomboid family intramembrane serine protease, partial [Cytophagaceae bacterium]